MGKIETLNLANRGRYSPLPAAVGRALAFRLPLKPFDSTELELTGEVAELTYNSMDDLLRYFQFNHEQAIAWTQSFYRIRQVMTSGYMPTSATSSDPLADVLGISSVLPLRDQHFLRDFYLDIMSLSSDVLEIHQYLSEKNGGTNER
jgi:hypothetical protein